MQPAPGGLRCSAMPLFSREAATYPPLDLLKPVAEGLWIVDSGPLRDGTPELRRAFAWLVG